MAFAHRDMGNMLHECIFCIFCIDWMDCRGAFMLLCNGQNIPVAVYEAYWLMGCTIIYHW